MVAWSPSASRAAEESPAIGGTLLAESVPFQPSSVYAEPIDLPGIEPIQIDNEPMFRVAGLADDVIPRPEDVEQTADPGQMKLPPGVRKGFFQRASFTSTYLPRFSDDGLGITDLEASLTFGFPFFRRDTPLLVTPRFAVHYLDGPAAPELPPRLFDASVDFTHLRKFGDGPWAMNVGVNLGHYSDFEQSSSDAFRVSGRGFAVYEGTPGRKWVMGVVYANRAGASVFPAVGVTLEPNPDTKYELIFPRPRIAKRIASTGPPGLDERWVYLGGEFGGGIWAFEPDSAPGTTDVVSYSDLRILAGYERKVAGGLSHRFEFGYVFARELEYESGIPDFTLDDSLLARIAITY
ncbi:MAG: DUF6268 family outer membrane beta-barrel protein [Planctomycetota bacterium]